MEDLKKQIEALLFAAGRNVSSEELARLTNVYDKNIINKEVLELKNDYVQRDAPLIIIQEGDSWKMTVHEKFISLVQKINPNAELSRTLMETLSIIAWKQPVLQSAVVDIKSPAVYEQIAELEKMGFISKERAGRSYVLKVTQKFMDYFDLPNKEAIKTVFKDITQQQQLDNFEKKEETEKPTEQEQ